MAAGVLLAALLLARHVAHVRSAGLSVGTDVFVSPCALPEEGDYDLWSSNATWPNGVVPGVDGTEFTDVSIPCGQAVMLDLANVTVGILQIQGHLRVLDDPSLPLVSLQARHVLVEGKFSVGSPSAQFAQKLVVSLLPSPGSAPLLFTSFEPASVDFPRTLGMKAFAVVGGQVDLHGMPGGADTPSWCQLSVNAEVGVTNVTVDDPLAANWPVGGEIVIATSDYSYVESEKRVITAVETSSEGVILYFDVMLTYNHQGELLDDGMGGTVDERAEVVLLTRQIVITAPEEPLPNSLIGGHFIIYQTPIPQYIEGVEFYKLGQQGILGRYSIHFHVVGSTPLSVVRKNSIYESNQRCIVVHATHNLTMERNVAYLSAGHCFSLEEGAEQNNTFLANVGVSSLPVAVTINVTLADGTRTAFTDDKPSTFWMSAPSNNFLANRAVGSLDSGFWIEGRSSVRGISLEIPALAKFVPSSSPLLQFVGNVVHSCHSWAVKTYPNGYRPPAAKEGTEGSYMKDMLVYKSASQGVFIHLSGSLTISGTFADNRVAVTLLEATGVTIKDSRFIGRTANYGTPTGCSKKDKRGFYVSCAPISGCTMPLPAGTPGRSHSGFLSDPFAAIALSQDRRISSHVSPHRVMASNFSNFNYECSYPGTTAAIVTTMATLVAGQSFNPHFSISDLNFINSNPLWFPPRIAFYESMNTSRDTGDVSDRYVIQDIDGSIIGSPGAIVANNPNLTAPGEVCSFLSESNAYACPGACYRSVRIVYSETGFESSSALKNVKGDFSYLQITRVSDGSILENFGNLNDIKKSSSVPERIFTANLLAGETYIVNVLPAASNPSFFPSQFIVFYLDGANSCSDNVTLRFQPPIDTNMQYFPDTSVATGFWKMCNGGTPRPADSNFAQFGFTCDEDKAYLEVMLPTYYVQKARIIASLGTQSCPTYIDCSLVWASENWLWDASGLERRPDFYLPEASTDYFNSTGVGPYGYNNVAVGFYVLPKPSPTLITYYFRKTFALADTACFSALYLQLFAKDGGVLYLNGNEFYRFNMPDGEITNGTLASSPGLWKVWAGAALPVPAPDGAPLVLAAGENVLAAEVHVASKRSAQMSFDMRLFGTRTVDCQGESASL